MPATIRVHPGPRQVTTPGLLDAAGSAGPATGVPGADCGQSGGDLRPAGQAATRPRGADGPRPGLHRFQSGGADGRDRHISGSAVRGGRAGRAPLAGPAAAADAAQPGRAQPPAGQAPARPGGASGPRVGDQGFHPRGPQLGLGLLMGQERSNPAPALPAPPAATLPTPDAVQPRGDQRPTGQALARPRHIGPRIHHHRLHPRGTHVRDRDQWLDPPVHQPPQRAHSRAVRPRWVRAPTPRHPIMPVRQGTARGPAFAPGSGTEPGSPGQQQRTGGVSHRARGDWPLGGCSARALPGWTRQTRPHRRVAHRQPNAAPDAPAIPAWAGT